MMTAQIIAWMSAIQGLMAIAPDVIAFAAKVKDQINFMFGAGMISVDVQRTLHSRVSEICRAALNGETPKHWLVEADPT